MGMIKNLRDGKTAQGSPRSSNIITSAFKGIGNKIGVRKKSGASEEAHTATNDTSAKLESLKTPAKAKFVSFVAKGLLEQDKVSDINKTLDIHETVYDKQAGQANNPRHEFREKLGELIGKAVSGDLNSVNTKKAQQILLNQNKGMLKQFVNDANKMFADPTLAKTDSHKLTMDTLEMAGLVNRKMKDGKPTYSLVKNPTGKVKSAQSLYKEQASVDMPTSHRLEYGNKEETEKTAAAATKIQSAVRGGKVRNTLKSVEQEKQINSKNALGSKDRAEQRATTEIKELFDELPNSEVVTDPFISNDEKNISKNKKELENKAWLSIMNSEFPETKTVEKKGVTFASDTVFSQKT